MKKKIRVMRNRMSNLPPNSFKEFFHQMIFTNKYKKIETNVLYLMEFPEISEKIHRILFPNSLEIFNSYLIRKNEIFDDKDIIKGCSELIILFSEHINTYIKLKAKYEKNLFSENYYEAFVILKELENSCGISMWSCGQNLILEEQLRGLEGNKKKLEGYIKDNSSILINTMLNFLSSLAENNMSFNNYQDNLEIFLKSIEDDKPLYEYFFYKFKIIDNGALPPASIILQIDSQISLIDTYNSFIELLQIYSYSNSQEYLYEIIAQIYVNINDYRLFNLLITGSNKSFLNKMNPNNDVCDIIENYTKGNYSYTLTQLEKYLEKKPDDFQMVILLIKTNIYMGKSINISQKRNLVYALYNIYAMNSLAKESLNNVYSYLKRYSGTTWKYKLYGIINRKLNNNTNERISYLSQINDHTRTLNFVNVIDEIESKKNFLKIYAEKCTTTFSLYLYIIGLTEVLETECDSVRLNFYISCRYMVNAEFEKAIEILEKLRKEIPIDNYYYLERIVRYLYNSYVNNDNFEKAINLIVEAYFTNELLIKRCNLKLIIKKFRTKRVHKIHKLIKFPIFTYLDSKSDYKTQRIAFSNYLDSNNVKDLSDFFTVLKSENTHDSVFLLDRICTQYQLKRDIRLSKTSHQADIVRIEILKCLSQLDSKNKKKYLDEVELITTKISISERVKQINKNKIYVDVDGLKFEFRDILLENYNKYLLLKSFDKNILGVDIYDKNYLENLLSKMSKRILNDVKYSQEIIILRNIILRITEEFLKNENFGLDTYLSSRIRHGYCKSQLTTFLREKNLMLMSSDDQSKDYNINEFWDSKISDEQANDYLTLKGYLKEFTIEIENKVEEIKNVWIKIKIQENDIGFFDFSNFINEMLLVDNDNIEDFDLFFNQIIQTLWLITEKNLSVIREKITVELHAFYFNNLNLLESRVNTLSESTLSNILEEINKGINLCKSDVEKVISEFSNVFYRADVTYKDFTLNELFETCLSIEQKLQKNFNKTNIEKLISNKFKYSGHYFPYFVDIIIMLFNNALEHNGFDDYENMDIKLELSEELDGEYFDIISNSTRTESVPSVDPKCIIIKLSNPLNYNQNIELIKEKITDIIKNAKDPNKLKLFTQIEGGSGLCKIIKIINHNILAHGETFGIFFKVEEFFFEIAIVLSMKNRILSEVTGIEENSLH